MENQIKNRNLRVYIPIFIGLFILLVDKIVLFKPIQHCCTNYPRENSFDIVLNSDFFQNPHLEEAKKEKKKIALNFGSSRSLAFYSSPTDEHIKSSPYLDEPSKLKLQEWEIINSAFPGSSIISQFVRFNQLLDMGIKPDVVLFELSHFSFNRNSMWYSFEIKNSIPFNFTLKHINEIPWSHTKTVWGSRVFAMSRYRIGAPNQKESVWDKSFKETIKSVSSKPKGIPPEKGVQEGRENSVTKDLYKYTVSEMKRTTFTNYKTDLIMLTYLDSILERANKENIKVIFWYPKEHSSWRKLISEETNSDEWKRIVNKIIRKKSNYIDLNSSDLIKCDYFMDPVHIDNRCYPEIAYKIIEKATEK